MEFGSVQILRNTIKEYFIHQDKEYVLTANDLGRVRAKCKGAGCEWVVYAKVMNDGQTFRVNTLVDNHSCGLVFNNQHVDSNWLAKHFLDDFRMNPNMEYKTFLEITQKTKYSMVSKWAFYRARKSARVMLEGSVADQFAILDDYCRQLLATNQGSTAKIKTTMRGGKRIFERLYICLKACKDGFLKGCRPLIGVDGCFLKGYCKGILLAAVGIDGTNAMFPIAYAMVEKENSDSWKWFLSLLKDDLEIDNPKKYTMISDRQKGLGLVLSSIFDGVGIRFCVRHLHSNFKKEYPGLLLKQFWFAARATTVEEWVRQMNELKNVSEGAHSWLMTKTPSEWSKSHFSETCKCDMLLNNLCESFNAAIIDARDKPIITLLEKIRYWLMYHFCNKRENIVKWGQPIGKRILKIIEKNKRVAKYCLPSRSTAVKFQVHFKSGEVFVVNLENKSCTCRGFQLNGIPCGHALACIWSMKANVMDYVHDYYKMESYVAAYLGVVEPMPSPDKWPKVGLNPIFPPSTTNLPGRPKKCRRREADEPLVETTKLRRMGEKPRCTNCKQSGHFRSTCPNPTVSQEQMLKKRGRPPSQNPFEETLKRRARKKKQMQNQAVDVQSTESTMN